MGHHSTSHYLAARRLLEEVSLLHAAPQTLLKLAKARAEALKAQHLDPDSPTRGELLSQIDAQLQHHAAPLAAELDRSHRDLLTATSRVEEQMQVAAGALREFDLILEALAEGRNPPEVVHPLQRLRAAWADQQAVLQASSQESVEVLTRADIIRRPPTTRPQP